MEVLQTPPLATSFTPLAEHQSRTPQSFYDGAPVLHYHSSRCKVVILESDLATSTALHNLQGTAPNTNGSSASSAPQAAEGEREIVIDGVDVWVASDKFFLYRTSVGAGVAIPYPLISLHAIQRRHLPGPSGGVEEVQGLYMQIANPVASDNTGAEEDEEEEDGINLTLIPPLISDAAGTETTAPVAEDIATEDGVDTKPETATQALYVAVSACSNLHPDPITHDEEDEDHDVTERPSIGGLLQAGLVAPGAADGGLPPPVDGSSGWITAENMHEYFDEEGNWIAGGEPPSIQGLGPGAGNVHGRDDDQRDESGEESKDDEMKWRRTD